MKYRAMFRDQELIVQASNELDARNKACEELRRLHPEDKKIQPHLIAVLLSNPPLDTLRDRVTGAIERGEGEAITEVKA